MDRRPVPVRQARQPGDVHPGCCHSVRLEVSGPVFRTNGPDDERDHKPRPGAPLPSVSANGRTTPARSLAFHTTELFSGVGIAE